ncbi:matrixin, partial [Acinetobacter sp. ULE_I053]
LSEIAVRSAEKSTDHRAEPLKQQLDIYNQKVYELNRQVGQLNAVNQQYNQSVDHFNSRFQPRQFDKGVFDGKTINIYEFASDADLRVTIAHELG